MISQNKNKTKIAPVCGPRRLFNTPNSELRLVRYLCLRTGDAGAHCLTLCTRYSYGRLVFQHPASRRGINRVGLPRGATVSEIDEKL